VERGAQLGDGVEVGPVAYVGPKVTIGDGCILGHGCHIEGKTRLGENNIVYPYAALGTPPQDLKYHGEDTELIVGSDNVFREYVSINKGTPGGGGVTKIGSRNYLMICSHIGHDCEVEDDTILVNAVLIGGHCRIESGAKIMGGAAANPFVTVGKLSYVGGLTRIISDVPPFMIVEGIRPKVCRVNEVGLQRAGYSAEAIAHLDRAYRRIYRTRELNRMKVVEEIEKEGDMSEEVRCLLEFLRRSHQGKFGRYRESLRA
jgi:UDP-N-acetylglucosamine acyltransferase